jgi:hypothetical protein
MDSVELQVAPEGETITKALQRLKDSGTGATVVNGEAGARVLTLDDLLSALRNQGDVALDRIPPGGADLDEAPENSEMPDGQEIQEQVATPEDPYAHGAGGGLDRDGSWGADQFVRPAPVATQSPTITITGAVAVVSGLNAGQISSLRATVTLWKCTIDPRHIYKKDELARQGHCNVDGAAVVLL